MLDAAALQSRFDAVAADCVRRLNLRVDAVETGRVSITMPVTPDVVHGGGVLCGQAILAAADSAMLMALIAELGEFRPMTTVQLQTSFLRPVSGDAPHVSIVARVLRSGRTLSYGDVEFSTPDGKLVAHATSTYAML